MLIVTHLKKPAPGGVDETPRREAEGAAAAPRPEEPLGNECDGTVCHLWLSQVGLHSGGQPRTWRLGHDGTIRYVTTEELEAGLDEIRRAPAEAGRVQLLVRRPAVDERETPSEIDVDVVAGVVGDNWRTRGSSSTPDHSASSEAQVTMMNARSTALVSCGDGARWKLAGDQIYVDFDLSNSNLPPGTRVRVGSAVLEISAKPHTGCSKFLERFGQEAMRFVNSPTGRELRLRGVNCRVVVTGVVCLGDTITKEVPPQ
jgi:hypothetical protein